MPGEPHRMGLLPLQLGLSGLLLWLGAILAMPGDTFRTGLGYAGMAGVASEGTWTGILIGSGSLGLLSVRDMTWGHVLGVPLRWHLACICIMAMVHLWLALLAFQSNPVGFGTPLFGTPGALGICLLWDRVTHDAYHRTH